MDLVYLVQNGDKNEELRYSLRSIAKFAPKFDNIWIVGYKPNWVANNVHYIETSQIANNRWTDARNNLVKACMNNRISKDFILMNDDFVLIKPIKNWEESLSKVKGSIIAQISEWLGQGKRSNYTKAFAKTYHILCDELNIKKPIDYELHIPMIINRNKFIKMLEDYPPIKYAFDNSIVVLYRSLYGNIFQVPYNENINDVKLDKKDSKNIETEWVSFFENCVGNTLVYPNFNKFLEDKFPNQCVFEKNLTLKE